MVVANGWLGSGLHPAAADFDLGHTLELVLPHLQNGRSVLEDAPGLMACHSLTGIRIRAIL